MGNLLRMFSTSCDGMITIIQQKIPATFPINPEFVAGIFITSLLK